MKFSISDCKVTVFQRDTEILLHFFFFFCIFPSLWPPFLSHFHPKSPVSLSICLLFCSPEEHEGEDEKISAYCLVLSYIICNFAIEFCN